ncbi:MAG: hydrolase [Nitrospiria bacterium]
MSFYDQNGFTPAWWCRNPHLQTVWRKFFGEIPALPLRRERWETPDDDFLDLDFLDPTTQSNEVPTVLLLHGFEGSSQAKYILGMLRWIGKMGWRGVALNFRSCSGEINWQPRFYHSGETCDLDWVIQKLASRFPSRSLLIVGFSLGGNVLLKWLGEKGERVSDSVRAAVAISVPFDLGVAAHNIDSGFGKLYGMNFLQSLKQKVLKKEETLPGLIDRKRVQRIRSYIDFEDRIFAPIHRFKDARDYWTRCSAKRFLEGVRRPTLILHAMDDPFLPGTTLPIERIRQSKWLVERMTDFGGHVGFVEGAWPWQPRYWAEAQTMGFLTSFMRGD